MTEYVIFLQEEDKWYEMGRTSARSASAAIRVAVDGQTGPPTPTPGVYSAVPARSWKPVTVKVETKTALRFS